MALVSCVRASACTMFSTAVVLPTPGWPVKKTWRLPAGAAACCWAAAAAAAAAVLSKRTAAALDATIADAIGDAASQAVDPPSEGRVGGAVGKTSMMAIDGAGT